MATTFYPRSENSDVSPLSGYTYRKLALTRGGAAVDTGNMTTVAGVGSGTEITQWWDHNDAGVPLYRFVSQPLDAVTISGSITVNIRALESSAMANYGVGAKFYKRSTGGTVTLLGDSGLIGAELGTSEAARNGSFTPGASWSIGAGERLIIELMSYAAGGTSASGYTNKGFFAGPTAAASGDTYVTFTETITEAAGGPAPNALALSLSPVAPRIDQSAAPGALDRTLAPVAPSIVFTVNPDPLAAAIAAVAPSRIDQTAPVGANARTLTPVAPQVDQAVAVAALTLASAALAPTRIDQALDPAAAVRSLIPVAPRVDQQVSIGALALALAALAPRVDLSASLDPLALTITGLAPRIDQALEAAAIALALTAVAPSSIDVGGVGGQSVSPAALALTASPTAPTQLDQTSPLVALAIALGAIAPTSLDAEAFVSPAALALSAAPTAPTRIDQTAELVALALAIAELAPTQISYPQSVSPAALALALAEVAPQIDLSIAPAVLALAGAVLSPVAMHFAFDFINIALSLATPNPEIQGGASTNIPSGADPWFRRQGVPQGTPIEAWSLYTSLVARYGLAEGRTIYERMLHERKGPFQAGAKYDPDRGTRNAIPHIEIPRAKRN